MDNRPRPVEVVGAPVEYGAGGKWPSLRGSPILFLPSDSGATHMGNSPAMVAPGVSVGKQGYWLLFA